MSIEVKHIKCESQFPIIIGFDKSIRRLTIKAAIELRNKLELAISGYQVDEAIKDD